MFRTWNGLPAKRMIASVALFTLSAAPPRALAQNPNGQAAQSEAAGDLASAKTQLVREAESTPANAQAQQTLAEFLCRHADPGCRDATLKWAASETDPARKLLAQRQLLIFDYRAGKDIAPAFEQYRSLGGGDLASPTSRPRPSFSTVTLPGPLSSFARMAALSSDLAPEDLLPALARNIVTNGYEASANEALQPTEYLRLLERYISQARELESRAKDGKLVVPACESEETADLLKILGYRMRGSCGADIVLETVNPTRAFITVDSAFPITKLEQDLRADRRFELPYASTTAPVLYNADYWLAAFNRQDKTEFVDAFVSDPSLCRLYLGLSHLERPAAEALRKQATPARLKLYSHVLDFFGGMFQIRDGAAVVPGSPKVWASLAGANPSNPGAFFEKLLSTDDGWLASYFDSLSRIDGARFEFLTQPDRLRRDYEALRGKITSPGPARPVFRSSTDLMLLTSALIVDSNGQMHVPGGLDVWRNLFVHHPHGKYDGKLTKSAQSWKSSEDLLQALFALSRKTVENEPLKIFLALNDIDRNRAHPISPDLASRLIADFRPFNAQYVLFAESPFLSETAIAQYLDWDAASFKIRDQLLRSDALGASQSLVELWRMLCRQDSIPLAARDEAFSKIVAPFLQVHDESDIFDAGRSGVNVLLTAAGDNGSGGKQERLVELLAGRVRPGPPSSPSENLLRILDAQRLVSFDGLFLAADRLEKGTADRASLKALADQLDRLQEIEPARGGLSSEEKNILALGYWSERHIDQERKLTVDNLLKGANRKDPKSALAPFLRDSLVGLVYAYYAPVGAQLSLTNPLLVRSHDFVGPEGAPAAWKPTDVSGSGWPESGGGRLTGSLIAIPYALAEAEQNFLTPKREQALIWGDLVPQMIASVTVNRWRGISNAQLRWVALHLERARSLLVMAALSPSIEPRVLQSLHAYLQPSSVEWIDDRLGIPGDFENTIDHIPPSVLYSLAADPALRDIQPDLASLEIHAMLARHTDELQPDAISRAFGTPKPNLTHSYRPGLLYLRTFPALMGYSSRILAESWESNNLYYAALADEAGVPAARLDCYVPEWNRAAIENIFATHLEDWPALLRSLDSLAAAIREHGAQTVAVNGAGN